MADRKLTIGVKTDLAGGKQLQKFLSELSVQGNKVAKSLANISLGSSTPFQKGALSKSLLEQKNLFSGLGKEAKSLADILKDTLGKSQDELRNKVKQTTSELGSAVREHERLKRTLSSLQAGAGNLPGVTPQYLKAFEGRVSGAHADLTQKMQAKNQAETELEALTGGGAQAGGMSAKFLGAAVVAGIFAAKSIGSTVGNAYSTWDSAPMQAQAELRGALAQNYRMILGGDVKRLWAMGKIGANPELLKMMGRAGSVGAQDMQNLGALSVNPFTGFGVNEFRKAMLRSPASATKNAQAMMDAVIANDPGLSDALDFYSREGRGRMGMMRRMGSRGMMRGLENLGTGYGMDLDQVNTTFEGIQSVGGRKAAQRLTETVMAAIASGFSGAAATQIAGSAAVTGHAQRIVRSLAGLAYQGTMDVTAAEQIGGLIGARAIGPSGIAQGTGLAASLMNMGFSGSEADRYLSSIAPMGLQAIGRMAGGQIDPFAKGMNLATAIGVMGPGASLYAQEKLAGLDADTLLGVLGGGDVPPMLKARGITKEQVRSQFLGVMRGTVAARYADINNQTDEAKVARALLTAGGDPAQLRGMTGLSEGVGVQHALGALFEDIGIAEEGRGGEAAGRILMGAGRGMPGAGAPLGDPSSRTPEGELVKKLLEANEVLRQFADKFGDAVGRFAQNIPSAMRESMKEARGASILPSPKAGPTAARSGPGRMPR